MYLPILVWLLFATVLPPAVLAQQPISKRSGEALIDRTGTAIPDSSRGSPTLAPGGGPSVDPLVTTHRVEWEELERADPQTLVEVLQGSVPGVYSLDLGARNDLDRTVRIRGPAGFDACPGCGPRVLLNGVETNSPGVGLMPSFHLAGIEVTSGPIGAWRSAPGAAPGAIHLTSRKEAVKEGLEVLGSAGLEHRGSPHVEDAALSQIYEATVSGRYDRSGFSTGVRVSDREGHVPHYGTRTVVGSAGFVTRAPGLEAHGFSRVVDHRFATPGWGSVYYDLYTDGLLPEWGGIDPNDYGEHRQVTVGAAVDWAPRSWFRSRAVAGYDVLDLDTYGIPTLEQGDSLIGTETNRYSLPSASVVSELELMRGQKAGVVVSAGADWRHRRRLGYGSFRRYRNEPLQLHWRGEITDEDYDGAGGFGEARLRAGDWLHLGVGLRADRRSGFGEDHGAWIVSPRAGAAATLRARNGVELRPRVAYAEGFQAPSRLMVQGRTPGVAANPRLGPQVTAGFEVAMELAALSNRLAGVIAFYDQRTSGAFTYLTPLDLPAEYHNGGEFVNRGTEIALRWRGELVEAAATYWHLDHAADTDSGLVANRVPEDPFPENIFWIQGKLSAAGLIGHPVSVGARARRMGERWAFDARSYFAETLEGRLAPRRHEWFPALTRLDVFAEASLTPSLRMSLDVRNAMADRTSEVPEYVVAGRRIHLSLTAEL